MGSVTYFGNSVILQEKKKKVIKKLKQNKSSFPLDDPRSSAIWDTTVQLSCMRSLLLIAHVFIKTGNSIAYFFCVFTNI